MPSKKPPSEPIDRDALMAEIDRKIEFAWGQMRGISYELSSLASRAQLAFEAFDEAMTAYGKLKRDTQKSE